MLGVAYCHNWTRFWVVAPCKVRWAQGVGSPPHAVNLDLVVVPRAMGVVEVIPRSALSSGVELALNSAKVAMFLLMPCWADNAAMAAVVFLMEVAAFLWWILMLVY